MTTTMEGVEVFTPKGVRTVIPRSKWEAERPQLKRAGWKLCEPEAVAAQQPKPTPKPEPKPKQKAEIPSKSTMPRLVHVIPWPLKPDGAHRVVDNLCRHSDGWDVWILAESMDSGRMEFPGAHILTAKNGVEAAALCKELQPDLLIHHAPHRWKRYAECPIVWAVHNETAMQKQCPEWCEPRAAIAYADPGDIHESWKGIVRFIPQAVDLETFRPALTAIVVGRVDENKVPMSFVRALQSHDFGPWRLRFIGDCSSHYAAKVKHELAGKPVEFVGSISADKMPAIYNEADALIVASETELAPCVIVEAWACGVPVIARDVGGIADMVGRVDGTIGESAFLCTDDAEILRIMNLLIDPTARAHMAQKGLNKAKEKHNAEAVAATCNELFEEVADIERKTVRKIDDTTIFVITCDDGTDNLEHCLQRLEAQNVETPVEVIRNVRPMNAAFQEMIDRCATPYFVQVDHDMMLYPGAIETMRTRIAAAKDNYAFCAFPLWDVHLDRAIIGVKIYRRDIMKRYPFQDSFSCEMDQQKRMKADGICFETLWGGDDDRDGLCVGEHGTRYTARTAFERYKRLIEKSRTHTGLNWVDNLPRKFLTEALDNPNEVTLAALFGAIAGALSDTEALAGEQDFENPPQEFIELWRMFCLEN